MKLLSRPAFHLLLVALVGLLAYANSFSVPFFLDDQGSIVENIVIKDLHRFLSGEGYAYNPRRFVGYLTVALNYRFGGLDVTGYHVFNLAVHVVSAWLVYGLVLLTLRTPFFTQRGEAGAEPDLPRFIPLCAALLFVAHPVQTQAVTYIIQRFASLVTLFFVLSLYCYGKARVLQERKGAFGKALLLYAGGAAAAACAMKTKETAFTLPFVILIYEFLFFRMSALKKLLLLAPVIIGSLVVPLSIIGTGRPIGQLISDIDAAARVTPDLPRLDYLFTQFTVIARYLRLLFLPVGQNLDYDFPIQRSFAAPPVLLSLALILALLALAVFLLRRSAKGEPLLRLASFGILWFFVTLSVESSIIPIPDVIFEHRVYLASVGAFATLAVFAYLLLKRYPVHVRAGVLGAVIVVLAGATFARNQVWGSGISLWSDVVRKSPQKGRPHYNLARFLAQENRSDEALAHALQAVRFEPSNPLAYNLIGQIMGKNGNYVQAAAALDEAIRLDPGLVGAHMNLGDVYRLAGLTGKALDEYEMALRLTPGDASIYYKMGLALAGGNDLEKAVVFLRSAAKMAPGVPRYQADLQRMEQMLRR